MLNMETGVSSAAVWLVGWCRKLHGTCKRQQCKTRVLNKNHIPWWIKRYEPTLSPCTSPGQTAGRAAQRWRMFGEDPQRMASDHRVCNQSPPPRTGAEKVRMKTPQLPHLYMAYRLHWFGVCPKDQKHTHEPPFTVLLARMKAAAAISEGRYFKNGSESTKLSSERYYKRQIQGLLWNKTQPVQLQVILHVWKINQMCRCRSSDLAPTHQC